MPSAVPTISGQSLRRMSRKYGPTNVCQMLVITAGTMTIASACAGGIVAANSPIDTVGRPSPITPLTKPASRKAPAIRSRNGSNIPKRLTDPRNRHNLEITEPAFVADEGWLVIASEAKQSIGQQRKCGLHRRGACHRARILATRWLLAMTVTLEGNRHAVR